MLLYDLFLGHRGVQTNEAGNFYEATCRSLHHNGTPERWWENVTLFIAG
ncbi:hypothetical protein [Scytonema sp. HK-05]|nr:hypothetical protein [Scytonema sp. HK-05]